ncbi:MAG: hypothetical protein ACOC2H_01370 [Spirochaetota bacterium]
MKIAIGILIGVALLAAIGLLFLMLSGPKKKDYAHLTKPRITEKAAVNALVVDFDGDPDIVIKKAFTSLFQAYYKLKGVPKGPGQPAPFARYTNFDELLEDTTTEELKKILWKGYVAIPVPDSVTGLPGKNGSGEYAVRIEKITYGTVAEVVHFGAYEDEMPLIAELKRFIDENGYEISGDHEEEYIKGPGMPFVKPRDYITIIRYQVKRK